MRLRTFIFYFFYNISLIIIASIALFLIFTPYRIRYFWLSLWAKFNIISLKKIVGIGSKIQGLENIPKENQKVIVLSNHQSTWETLFFQTIFKQQTWLLKKELLWIPIFGWAIKMLKPIAISRSKGFSAIKKLLKEGQKRLDDGIWLVIFPEGTRKPYQSEPKKNSNQISNQLKTGGMKLASDSDCLILMVRHNAGKYWPKKGQFQAGNISLEIAPTFKSRDAQEIKRKCADFFYQTTQKK